MAELSQALSIVQSQQAVVGKTIMGGAGSVANTEGSTVGILEQIRDISLKSFRGVTKTAETLAAMFGFEKQKDRREKDQAAELAKEKNTNNLTPNNNNNENNFEDENSSGSGGMGGFLSGFGFGSLIKSAKKIMGKIIKPFTALLASLGRLTGLAGLFTRLTPLLAPLGPVGLVISGLFLVIQYAGEIAKALSPLIDGLKKTFEILKPILKPIFELADFMVKLALGELATALTAAFGMVNNTLSFLVDNFIGLSKIIYGIVTGDFDIIKEGFAKIKTAFATLGDKILNAIIGAVNGLIDALPFVPQKIKDKMKFNEIGVEASKDEQTTKAPAESVQAETQSIFKSGDDTPSTNVASAIEEPKEVVTPKVKPKTINMDKTSSVVQVAEKITGDTNLPPLGMNMYKTTGDTYDERAKQWYGFKDALVQAEKDGSISKEEIEFRVMQLTGERDSLKNAKKILSIGKQRAELKGETFDEAAKLSDLDSGREKDQANALAAEGMTVKSYDEALNNKLQPNVNKRDLAGEGAGSQGNVTVVNNQPTSVNTSTSVAKTSVSSSPINVSSGDSYFDRQAS